MIREEFASAAPTSSNVSRGTALATIAQVNEDDPQVLRITDAARIAVSLRNRDRAAIRKWYDKLATGPVAPGDRKWLARLAVASGEFERAWATLRALQQDGALELEDACLLIKVAATLKRDVGPAEVFARVDFSAAPEVEPRFHGALLQAANLVFEAGNRVLAARLFDALAQQGYDKPDLNRARYGESLLAARQYGLALDVLMRADAADPLGEWSLCALADAAFSSGRTDVAENAFDRLRAMDHASIYFLERYVDFLTSEGRIDDAAAFLEEMTGKAPDAAVQRLKAVIALESGDLDRAVAAFADLSPEAATALGDRVAGFAYRLLPTADEATLTTLAAFVERIDSTKPGMVQFAIDLAFRRQDYDAAGRAIEHARNHLDASKQTLLLLKAAELEAFLGNIDVALETIAAMGPLQRLPSEYLSPVATIFAEARAWPEIMVLARTRLGDWFRYPSHGATVLSAAAAEDGWEELFEAIERSLARADSADVRKLRIVTMERVVGSNQLEALLEDDDARRSDAYQVRLIARAEALAVEPEEIAEAPGVRSAYERDTAIFYCTDTGYLSPAFNSINSLLMSNGAFLDDTAIHLFVEPEDVDVSEAVAEGLRRHYGCSLTITPSARLLERFEGKLRTDYGLFTGGMQLSQSAYYRIFALQYLLDTDAKRRALYIDSDTLVIGEISRIFSSLDGAHPLAVRREIEKFEVRRVEALHGLQPGSYFNSGVLAVDMEHADLRRHLALTMREVTEHADKLVYHDQCALNRGFQGHTAGLPKEFNSFCTVHDSLTSPGAAGVILHFLDRPKPWQPGYEGSLSAFWYRYWRALANVADADALAALLARSSV